MVVKGEYGLTAAMEKHGYTIDTLMSKYRRVGGGGGGNVWVWCLRIITAREDSTAHARPDHDLHIRIFVVFA